MKINILNSKLGQRVLYNPENGFILNYGLDELGGNIYDCLRPDKIEWIDLEYGDHTVFQNYNNCYVDINTKKVVIGGICMPTQGE